MTPTRFSPRPLVAYGLSARSQFFRDDPDAWNLAYLSWDFETKQQWPDPDFSTHVRRTLQFMPKTGQTLLVPNQDVETVRTYLRGTPPRAAHLILTMVRIKELPLFKAYGQYWADTLDLRARAYREPHHDALDFDVLGFTEAERVISQVK